MCCAITILLFLGPRFFNIVWWIGNPNRWDRAFDSVFWPILGIVFAPWTTLMYVIVQPGGVDGFEWFFIATSVVADLAMWGGGGYRNRDQAMSYYGSRS